MENKDEPIRYPFCYPPSEFDFFEPTDTAGASKETSLRFVMVETAVKRSNRGRPNTHLDPSPRIRYLATPRIGKSRRIVEAHVRG